MRRRKLIRKIQRMDPIDVLMSILLGWIAPFVIMCSAALIPLTIAARCVINDEEFSILKFFGIYTPISLVTITIGVLIIQYINSGFHNNDLYLK